MPKHILAIYRRGALTYTIASAAGADAANRRMRSEGRDTWDWEDFNLAVRTLNVLLDNQPLQSVPPSETERGR